MGETRTSLLDRFFRFVIAKRWWVLACYAVALAPAAWLATRVGQDNSLNRLIVQSDPDYQAAKAFEKVFGGGQYVIVVAEAEDPFAPEVLKKIDAIDRRIAAQPHLKSNSVLAIWRRAKAGASPAEDPRAFKTFVTGSSLFRSQGLAGDHFLAIPVILDISESEHQQTYAALRALDAAIADDVDRPAPLIAVRRVGQPYVNEYLDTGTTASGKRCFPIFFGFVFVLCLGLYRSVRALLAFILSLGVSVTLSVGFVGLVGGTFTIVSALVPMTVLITCTANLVYLHSRFVERPLDRSVDDHQIFALRNKFLACTASIFATATGFAALAVSKIRPIREMGVWIAVGLGLTWLVVFTLFPALQKILRTPTQGEQKVTGQGFRRLVVWLPAFSWRWRWLLVPGALVASALGAVALFGLPGVLPAMRLEADPIHYIDHGTQLYKDTQRLAQLLPGLGMTDIWLKGKQGSLDQVEIIRGIDRFQAALEADPMIGSVVGPTTILRMVRYIGGQGDTLPEEPEEMELLTENLGSMVARDPLLGAFIETPNFSQAHLTVVTKSYDYSGFIDLEARIQALWDQTKADNPALGELTPQAVGLGPLQAKIAHHLVPTLVQSFGLTVLIIFATFLVIFRNGAARLMAMIPSLFAILVMFGVMRLTGLTLNVATILIASTVLGTSENDQIHFFFHFLERQKTGTTEEGLRHTILIAGRPILFATLINAGGFLAFALSDMPPMREFAVLTATAFLLSMVADFTALPAALWLVFRDRPDLLKPRPAPPEPGKPSGG